MQKCFQKMEEFFQNKIKIVKFESRCRSADDHDHQEGDAARPGRLEAKEICKPRRQKRRYAICHNPNSLWRVWGSEFDHRECGLGMSADATPHDHEPTRLVSLNHTPLSMLGWTLLQNTKNYQQSFLHFGKVQTGYSLASKKISKSMPRGRSGICTPVKMASMKPIINLGFRVRMASVKCSQLWCLASMISSWPFHPVGLCEFISSIYM